MVGAIADGDRDDGRAAVGLGAVRRHVASPGVPGAVWPLAFQDAQQVELTDECLVPRCPALVSPKERIEARYLAVCTTPSPTPACRPEIELRVDDSAATVVDLERWPGLDSAGPPTTSSGTSSRPRRRCGQGSPGRRAERRAPRPRLQRTRVNPRYTFDASSSPARPTGSRTPPPPSGWPRPGPVLQPLFIYGERPGKTHLLHAIANYVTRDPSYRVRYVSTETFLNQFVYSGSLGTADESSSGATERSRSSSSTTSSSWRAGAAPGEFSTPSTSSTRRQPDRLSSDRPPDAIPTLEVRLRSRFQMA